MALEPIGLVLGTSGLLTVASKGLQLTRAIRRVKHVPREVLAYHSKFENETIRFSLWAESVFGRDVYSLKVDPFAADLPSALESDSQLDIKPALYNALHHIQEILEEAYAYFGRLGVEFSPLKPAATAKADVESKMATLQNSFGKMSTSSKVGFGLNTTRAAPKNTLEDLHKDLVYWLDQLYMFAGHHHADTLRISQSSRVLANRNSASALQALEDDVQGPVSSAANFKRLRLQILDGSSVQSAHRIWTRHMPRCKASATKGSERRKIGMLQEPSKPPQRVIVEWKTADRPLSPDEQRIPTDRISRLSQILQLPSKPSGIRSLDCLGYSVDGAHFGLVYRMPDFAGPRTDPTSLLQAIAGPKTPTLGDKFRLAGMLAVSLMHYLSLGWLHKAFCTSNILFFENDDGKLDYAQPFVSGFEYSRPDDPIEISLPYESPGREDFDIASHPDVPLQGQERGTYRYQRRYDIYSLGVCLLEIGCWRSIQSICSQAGLARDGRILVDRARLKNELIGITRQSIPPRMGTTYRDVIVTCLDWPQYDDSDDFPVENELEQFDFEVPQMLRKCHCGNA